jgi:hypothetical protein
MQSECNLCKYLYLSLVKNAIFWKYYYKMIVDVTSNLSVIRRIYKFIVRDCKMLMKEISGLNSVTTFKAFGIGI